jgi:hypothetical protein
MCECSSFNENNFVTDFSETDFIQNKKLTTLMSMII